jgi:hypothetical protein
MSSLYKYVSIIGLRRILDGSIRFTQPGAFNDPFELLPELVIPINGSARDLNISFDVKAKRRYPPIGELEDVTDQLSSSDATSRDIVKKLNDAIGMLCLSKTNNSLLMWSHYSDQYAGAVIEFDGDQEFFDGQIDVDYRKARVKKDISIYLHAHEPVPVAELCIKSEEWRYEDEVRIVRTLSGCNETAYTDGRGFKIFTSEIPRACIKSITIGERTPVPEQRKVYEIIKETEIAMNLAAVSDRGYELRKETIKYASPASKTGPIISPRTAHIFSHLSSPVGDLARFLILNHPMSKIVNNTV